MQGIVYKSTGSWYIVKDQQNNFIECKLAGKLRNSESKSTNPVCTGDSVTVKINNNKTPIIEERLMGIKGQYLLFENGLVLNMRKHQAYVIEFSADENQETAAKELTLDF